LLGFSATAYSRVERGFSRPSQRLAAVFEERFKIPRGWKLGEADLPLYNKCFFLNQQIDIIIREKKSVFRSTGNEKIRKTHLTGFNTKKMKKQQSLIHSAFISTI
jgi:hypothetical protein